MRTYRKSAEKIEKLVSKLLNVPKKKCNFLSDYSSHKYVNLYNNKKNHCLTNTFTLEYIHLILLHTIKPNSIVAFGLFKIFDIYFE